MSLGCGPTKPSTELLSLIVIFLQESVDLKIRNQHCVAWQLETSLLLNK